MHNLKRAADSEPIKKRKLSSHGSLEIWPEHELEQEASRSAWSEASTEASRVPGARARVQFWLLCILTKVTWTSSPLITISPKSTFLWKWLIFIRALQFPSCRQSFRILEEMVIISWELVKKKYILFWSHFRGHIHLFKWDKKGIFIDPVLNYDQIPIPTYLHRR